MIIAAYAGVGKSTFCEENPQNAIDVISMPFKYSNFYEVSENVGENEDIKAHADLKMRKKWYLYYYWVIKYLVSYAPEKYIVIPTIDIIMDFLDNDHIPYTIVIPDVGLKDEYEKRYKERGNNETFMSVFIGQWEDRITNLMDRNAEKIILKSNEYLSTVLDCTKFNNYQEVYLNKQLLSFENSLKRESWRNEKVRRELKKELAQHSKYLYAKYFLCKSISRHFYTDKTFRRKLEESNDAEAEVTVIDDYEGIMELIDYTLREINLNYLEYSKDGALLRFTSDISANLKSSTNKQKRCLDPHNYLNVWSNPAFSDWTVGDAERISVAEIRDFYLKEFLSRIIGLLRKGSEYMPYIVTDKITDDELTTLVCLAYKKHLISACCYQDGYKNQDKITGILYNKPSCADNVVDDYVIIESKEQLKILLKNMEDEIKCIPSFSLLEEEYIEGCLRYKETVFEYKERKALLAFLEKTGGYEYD